jgi:hypothetical protein
MMGDQISGNEDSTYWFVVITTGRLNGQKERVKKSGPWNDSSAPFIASTRQAHF